MKIALFFGSFNPIHVGHLIVAETVTAQTEWQNVWFVVSPQNPFKKNNSLLHEQDRYDMVRLAIQENPKFNVSDIEFRMPRPSYTIDTLQEIKRRHPQHQFRLIIGEDNLSAFPKWKNYEKILDEFGLLVYPRLQSDVSELWQHPKVEKVFAPLIDVSATYIRESIKAGKSVKYIVVHDVEKMIELKRFYQ